MPGTRPFWQIYGEDVDTLQSDLTTPGTSLTVVFDNADPPVPTVTVNGTYHGVSGTFTCTDTCTATADRNEDGDTTDAVDYHVDQFVRLDSDNQREFNRGTWRFDPLSVSRLVLQMRDNEHVYFGIWVQEPNIASADHNYEFIVGGLTDGNDPNDPTINNFDALTGTAVFTGGAIGKYVTIQQVGQNASIGTFNADARLTANFDINNLEGRITNFRDGGQALTGNWNVYLGARADGAPDTDPATVPIAFAGGTVGDNAGVASGSIGGVTANGMWDATLYGSDNNTDLDRDDYPVTRYPVANLAGIVGNFYLSSTNAALAGAFGATP